ncbi:MAG: hypothetical protein M3Y85_00125 [Bacteroidota bacterium]|nr:hypothetical protein [Bacteroidota bacterium]
MKYFFIILSCFITSLASAQVNDTAFSLVKTYKGDIVGAAMDNLDALYLISSTGQVKKFGPRGDSIGVFNGIRNNGKLYSIDVTNPLRPLLFYKDFSSVVILDRFLANRTTIDLRRHNILQPSAIGLSYDNNIWVYDMYDNKLRKVDESGNIQLETSDFRQLFGKGIAPQKIINDDGLVYLTDSATGIFVFDNYGTFKKKIELKGWADIEVRDGKIIRLNQSQIVIYNPSTFLEQSRKFPPRFTPYIHSFTNSNKLVTFSQDSLRIYQFRY